jgi:hypothetical protein
VARVAIALLVLFALTACGGSSEQAGPIQAKDDPARGIYNYDHARAVGIRVPPVPPADEICPPPPDSPSQRCTADPRLGTYSVGYSVEAVRSAPNAFTKGRLICGGRAPSLPGSFDAAERREFVLGRLRHALGVTPGDPLAELVAGCRTTSWGASVLLPD